MKKIDFAIKILSLIMAACLFGAFTVNASGYNATAEDKLLPQAGVSDNSLKNISNYVRTDAEKFFDDQVVYRLPEDVPADTEISVIVSMGGNTVMDVYERSAKDMEFSEFVTTEEAILTEKAIDAERNKLLSKLKKTGIEFSVGEKYDTLLCGFELNVKAGDFEALHNVFGDGVSLIIGDEYERMESKIVTNDVQVYPTGIFDSSTSLYQGDGVVVAILDTGLDYTHPAFDVSHFNIQNPAFTLENVSAKVARTSAAKFTYGLTGADVYMNVKVPYAYDYADKDSDVLPINSEHGTHVAGIIAGRDDRITGVAPEAQLAIMKVFSDNITGAKSSWIIAALEDCITLGVDVINMSLGSSNGFTREVDKEQLNVIYDRVKESGISLIASAGNEANATRGSKKNGVNGLTSNPDSGTVGAPSTYEAALSVASVDGVKTPYIVFNGRVIYFNEATDASAKKKDFVSDILKTVGEGVTSHEFEFVTIPGIGRVTDYPNVNEFYKGKIVLVKRGETTFEEKIRIAIMDKGAAGIIIYNNISGTISMAVGAVQDAACCSISQDDGEFLAAAKTGKILISQDQKAGPFMSDFSSWGPTSDLKIKPEITGHGGEIESSVPGRAYDKMSGTSMSAPNVAGAAALIRQFVKYTPDVFGTNLTPNEVTAIVNMLMMSTADIMYNKNGLPYAVRKQGAGLVNITKSYTTPAYLITYNADGSMMDRTKLELGDDKNKTGVYEMTFAIKNISNRALDYDVNSIVITEGVSETYTGHGDTTVTQDGYLLSGTETKILSVEGGTQSGNKVSVAARGTAKVTVKIVLSAEDKAYMDRSFKNGMYVEGFITLRSSNSADTNLNIPLLAFYGDWTKAPIFDEEYYDTNADELNAGLDDNDKLMADGYATRVYGGLYSDYISVLGSYYFAQDSSAPQIAANKEHISISNQKDYNNLAVNSIRSISAGLLRNAKRVHISIVEDATGKEIFNRTECNVRKSVSYGSDMYGSSIDVEFDALAHDLKNNTKYTVTVSAFIDYGTDEEQNNARNVFEFPLYIDFEAPLVKDVTYRTEYDSTTKKTTYYADITVYDNHYAMGLSLGQIIPADLSTGYAFELNSFGKYMTPIYSTFNSDAIVTINLTDYIADIKNSAGIKFYPNGDAEFDYNNNSYIVAVYDYALNGGIYQLRLPDEFLSVQFKQEEIVLSPNESLRLAEIMDFYPAGSWLNTLDYEVSESDIVEVVNQTLVAKSSGTAEIAVKGYNENGKIVTKATLRVRVLAEGEEGYNGGYTVPQISKFEISGYKVEKAFYSVSSSEREIGITDGTYSFGSEMSLSMFPSESVTLRCVLDSYFPGATSLQYVSSAEDIATVTETGTITALAEGDASVFVNVLFNGRSTYYSGVINITVKDPFETLSIYLNSYKGLGGTVVIPDDRGITIINTYAFSGYEYVDKDLAAGDVIDDEDPYYIKQSALTEETIKKVIIPEGVTTIEQSAFQNLVALEEVVLPASLIRIGRNAFSGCVNLRKINLGNVKFINERAFSGCNLSEADLGEVVAIGNYSFENCKLTKIVLPEYSQSLGEGAFYGNARLREVTFNAAKIKIGPRAFENCGLIDIDINAAVISPYAFYNCNALKDVTLGKDVSVIGEYAFAGTGVSSFKLNAYNGYFKTEENGAMLVTKEGNELVLVAPKHGENGTITTHALKIGSGAFSGNMATRIFADEATEIGNYAFAGCSQLSFVSLSSAVGIGDGAFIGTDINKAEYLSHVKNIGERAFYGTNLEKVVIADGCKVGRSAFAECRALTEVVIGNNVEIGESAFFNTVEIYVYDENAGATNVIDDRDVDNGMDDGFISSEVNQIIIDHYERYMYTDSLGNVYEDYRYRFEDGVRSNLKKVTVGDNVTIGDHAFDGNAKMETVTLGNGARIGNYAFYNAAKLSEIDLSAAIEIGDYAFSGFYTRDWRFYEQRYTYAYETEYDEVGNVVSRTVKNTYFSPAFPECDISSAVSVGEGAFAYNVVLSSLTLSENITSIADYTFAGCTSLTEVVLPPNVTEIGAYAFYKVSAEGVDLGSVPTVGEYAFSGSKLKSVILSEGSFISNGAFAYCFRLQTADWLESAVYIGADAFNGCLIEDVNFASAEYIGDYAFANSALASVTFGENLADLGENPFYNCKELKTFGHEETTYFNGQIVEVTFSETYKVSDSVEVIDGALYKKVLTGLVLISYPYGREGDSYTVAEGTVRISAKAFFGTSIKDVTLPTTLKAVGDKAFYGCNYLTTVIFRSYYAPVLEEAYDASYVHYSNIPITGYASFGGVTYEGLGIVDFYMWNIATHGNNYYFGANFKDYIGKVTENMVMVYPANGQNYDSFILSKYFSTSVEGANTATVDTLKAIALINSISASISLADETAILAARTAYDAIPTLEQKALVTNYSKLTSAEATLNYLKSRDNESSSGGSEEKTSEDNKPSSGNTGLIVLLIISGIVNAVAIAGAVVYFVVPAVKKKKAGSPGENGEENSKEGDGEQ